MPPKYLRILKNLIRPLVPESVLARRQFSAVKQLASKKGVNLAESDLFFDLIKEDKGLRIRKGHKIYLQHMIENFDYYVESVVPLRTDGTMLVDMSGPRYHRLTGFGQIPFLFPSHTEPYRTTEEYLDFASLRGAEKPYWTSAPTQGLRQSSLLNWWDRPGMWKCSNPQRSF